MTGLCLVGISLGLITLSITSKSLHVWAFSALTLNLVENENENENRLFGMAAMHAGFT